MIDGRITVFLYGALHDQAILGTVLGRPPGKEDLNVGQIDGFRSEGVPEQREEQLRPDQGGALDGFLISVSEQEYTRLSYYIGEAGWHDYDRGGDGLIHLPLAVPVTPHKDDRGAMRDVAKRVMALLGAVPGEDIRARRPFLERTSIGAVRHLLATPVGLRAARGAGDLRIESHQRHHQKFYRLDEICLRHTRFDGAISDTLCREVLVSVDVIILLPYDAKRDRVMVLEQFRPGPLFRAEPNPWMLEPIAGRIDPGETPEEAARRESREEGGLEIQTLLPLGGAYPSPGTSNEYFHNYIGLCDLPDLGTGQGGLRSEGEDIRTHVIDFAQLLDAVENGEASAGPLQLVTLWLERRRASLKSGA